MEFDLAAFIDSLVPGQGLVWDEDQEMVDVQASRMGHLNDVTVRNNEAQAASADDILAFLDQFTDNPANTAPPNTVVDHPNAQPGMLQQMPEPGPDGSISAFGYLDSVLAPQPIGSTSNNDIDPALLMPPPPLPFPGQFGSQPQLTGQQQLPFQAQLPTQLHTTEDNYIYNVFPTYDRFAIGALSTPSPKVKRAFSANDEQTQPKFYWNQSPSPSQIEERVPLPPPETQVLQPKRRISAPRASKSKTKAAPTANKNPAKASGTTGARRGPKPKPRLPKVFPLAPQIQNHEFFPYLLPEDITRLKTRVGGKQLKEMNIIRCEREGKHFTVPKGYECSKCARFGYPCMLGRIVDYGHHAEATLGHCRGCTGNSDGCTFHKRPEARLAAYSAYYEGQTFAIYGKLGKGTQVYPYKSMNAFTRNNAIVDPTVRRPVEE
ncbi:hypothetical protein CspHIS471_0209210 [Cutaneotrichosporon sp. HIS471]|nr:hypothetical protein CspHIS471_0209210 [Cutaneotrichosporon sp. HIS471]